MNKLKQILIHISGFLMLCMAMLELFFGFISVPHIINFADEKADWWSDYLPLVFLINMIGSSVLLSYGGMKVLQRSKPLSEEYLKYVLKPFSRYLEKRRYGYQRSEYFKEWYSKYER